MGFFAAHGFETLIKHLQQMDYSYLLIIINGFFIGFILRRIKERKKI